MVLALTAGMVGAVNPCGFSLLPAYVGSFVTGDGADAPPERRLVRAIGSATAVTVGFVLVFVVLGMVLSSIADQVREQLPWVTMAVGALLVMAGFALLAGRRLPLPAVALRSSRGRGPVAMVSYGAIYALASLSCTIGPFLAITAAGMGESIIGGLVTFLAYALGMGLVILVIAASAALARPRPVLELRRASRLAPRLGGLLMILSGGYAIWYSRWELAVYRGDLQSDVVIDIGERLRVSLIVWIQQVGAISVGVGILAAVGLTVVGLRLGARRSGSERTRYQGTSGSGAVRRQRH